MPYPRQWGICQPHEEVMTAETEGGPLVCKTCQRERREAFQAAISRISSDPKGPYSTQAEPQARTDLIGVGE